MKVYNNNEYNKVFLGINGSSKFIPKLADAGETRLSSYLSKEIFGHGGTYETNISGNSTFFDSLIHHGNEGIESVEGTSLLSNFGEQAMDTLPLLSLYFKYKEPLDDFKSGDMRAGLVKSGVRVGESLFLLPFKLAWATCGGVLGGFKSICGIKSESSGLGKGFMSANGVWNKVRHGLEDFVISPHTFFKNLTRDRKGEIIKNYDNWEKNRNEEINDNLEFLMLKNQYVLEQRHQATMEKLSSAELHIDQILNMIPPSKPIEFPVLERLCKRTTSSNEANIIEEYSQQQSEYESFYNTSIAEIENILKNDLIKEDEKEIVKRILNKIQHYYDTTIKVNNENLIALSKMLAIHEYLYGKANLNGFNKIAGYEELKQQLQQTLLTPIKMTHAGKEVDLPNMILFYGPQGCGKTIFSKALAEEAHCNFIDISLSLNEQKNLKNIIEAINKAKQLFETDGLYTIIKIDEYDALSLNDNKAKKEFNKILNSLSKENHCTIVATSNFQENIDSKLIPQNNFKNYFVASAQNEDLRKLLEFYLKEINLIKTAEINYSEVVNSIQNDKINKQFSNARIVKILQNILLNSNTEITTESLINTFKKKVPDISNAKENTNKRGRN